MGEEAATDSVFPLETESSGGLSHLRLERFRNLRELEFHPHPQFNFFYGDNAQGKTSILEAVFFLSELRSFRSPENKSLIQHGEEASLLSGKVSRDGIRHEIDVKIGPEEKEVALNGKTPRPFRRLRKLLPMVLFTPDSVRFFRVSPSERRSYFDHFFGLISETFSFQVTDYARALKHKSALLERIRERGFASEFKEELEVWNERLASLGAEITHERILATRRLGGPFNVSFHDLSGGDWKTELIYQPHLSAIREKEGPEVLRNFFREEMARRLPEEIERNQVLVGPHRDDWFLRLGEGRLREEGSQGQQRVAVASLKLAMVQELIENGLTPTALFDDLLSELDSFRSARVLASLSGRRCQVFLTSIAPDGISLKDLPGDTYRVEGGKMRQTGGV